MSKFTFLDSDKLAVPILIALDFGGLGFEKKSINTDQSAAIKSECPFGKIPVLEVNGQKYVQTQAIMRYLGKVSSPKLYPDDPLEACDCDMIMDAVDELKQRVEEWKNEQDEDRKSKLGDALKRIHVSQLLKFLNTSLRASGDDFFGGPQVNIADIYLFPHLKLLNEESDW
eukprot:CAMPEP_0117741086 /NCGR_PEP_ID=MMETSP0947-20121206/4710_1 /TAXON_ID=44440 /ORGANISM="Chattonella subsalsa, Strain CCMP2191" /LENGTH=170 /DNA_ID=CAMNT_0005557289 /DNA_START=64 /DNA_END=573 /DNA_ORIENTATION=-